MARAHNFCAGPAALPESVLARAQAELLDWRGLGCSVMEVSHRSAEFIGVIEAAETSLRRLLSISDDYAVLFLQGGASQQFSAVPFNLAASTDVADYVVSGQWSKKALSEGRRLVQAAAIASSEDVGFSSVPARDTWQLGDNARYCHYCPNETIGGLAFPWVPTVSVPLVADMSSVLLAGPLDVNQFDVIYAGAQKNIGPAGLTLLIVRRSLLSQVRADCPASLSWQVAAEHQSMANTPPTFAIYLAGLVFEWLEALGGLPAIEIINRRKADKLYELIDGSDFYSNPIDPCDRSIMNVPFTLVDPALDARFLAEAEQQNLLNLKGHRSVGGMRASLYNAVPEASVDALCAFMKTFEQQHG